MQIIKTSGVSNMNIPSRVITNGIVNLHIQKENTRTPLTDTVTATYLNGVISFDYDFNANEGDWFFIVIDQSGVEILKSKVFCTDQTDLQNYEILEGVFKSAPATDNTFKTA